MADIRQDGGASAEPKRLERVDECHMTGDVTLFFTDGTALKLDRRDYQSQPLSWWMQSMAALPTNERVDVIQYGRKVGELPAYWHPGLAQSSSFLYDYRPGDLTLVDGKWIASETLGGGDLDCLLGFVRKDQHDE